LAFNLGSHILKKLVAMPDGFKGHGTDNTGSLVFPRINQHTLGESGTWMSVGCPEWLMGEPLRGDAKRHLTINFSIDVKQQRGIR